MASALELVIDLGGNALDLPLLRGFIGVSGPLRTLGLQLEQQGSQLTVRNGKALEPGTVSELLRVLGGSCKGDSAIRVLSPEQYTGETAIPQMHAGAERWACPRCEREVMAGANDCGQRHGLCEPCWSVDMRLAGVADPKKLLKRLGSDVAEILQAPAPAPAIASREQHPRERAELPDLAGKELRSVPVERAPRAEAAQTAPALTPPSGTVRVLWVASPADLPAPELGLLAVSHGRFYWATPEAWYYLEGHPPPVL